MYHLQRIKVLLATCMLACASLWAQDTKIAISGATADSYHRDYGALKAIDGVMDNYWHSGNVSGYDTTFPVTFTITLNQASHVDYVRYYPRTDSSNGHWDAVTVSYCSTTTGSSFTTLGSYTLNGAGAVFDFPIGKTCGQVKFTINSGRGGWATASEIEAYAYNTAKMAAFAEYFTDGLYTQLKSGVASSNGIADDDVKALVASMLENATEYKKFRVGEYEPYMTTATVQRNLKTANLYNNYENPTGIYLKVGESCIVAVSGINGNYPVGLKIKDWYKSGDLSSYSLHNGLNYITATTEGNVFVDYYTDDFENAPNVQMHFINAPVLGYWDQATMTNDDWVSMLAGPLAEDDEVIIITRSEHAQTAYPVKQWKQYCPDNVNATMTNYQNVQWALRDIMGLEKFNRQVKNRQLFYADQSGMMYAGSDASVCGYGDLRVLVTPDASNFDFWGVGHEWGHNNQMQGFLWSGCTETTNNIPAAWAQFKFTGNRDANEHPTYLRLEDEVTGVNDYKDMRGGRMQTYFEEGLRKGIAWQLQDGPDYHNATPETKTVTGRDADGNDIGQVTTTSRNYDHFVKLSPFWQLNLWGTLANKCPDIIPTVIERIRATENYTATYNTNGKQQINWMKLACDAAQINLLPFFEKAGMLRPIHAYIEDYSEGWNIITEEMINELKTYVAGKNYPAYTEEINYINGHNYHIYRDNLALNVTGMQGVLNGDKVTIQHSVAQNAVAFETYNAKDELIRITMYGLGSDDTHSYTQVLYPSSFDQSENAAYILAVGYDGSRERVYQTYANEAEAIYGELGRLLSSVEAMQKLCSNDKVGYYKATALTDLNTAYETAKAVYDNQESTSYETVYDALNAEYEKVQNNKYARVGIVEGNAYRLENKAYDGRFMSINSEKMIVGETTDLTDKQKWYFEASDTEGYYYIKNKSTQTYPGDVETSTRLFANKTKSEAHAYKLQDMGNGAWALVGNTGLHQGSDVYDYGIVGWKADADASQWYITAVELNANAESLYELKALIDETESLMGRCGTVTLNPEASNKVKLQTTSSSSAYYVSTNAQSTQEGPISGLVDGKYGSSYTASQYYFHTDYSGNNSTDRLDHHITINLGEGNAVSKFKFQYWNRTNATANFIAEMKIYGKKGNGDYTLITTINNMSATAGATYESSVITCAEEYDYLRFMVTKTDNTNNIKGGHPITHMAEFELTVITPESCTVELEEAAGDASVDQLLATYEQWEEAKEVSQNATSVEQVQEAIDKLTAAKEALSAAMQTNNKAALRELVARATALIDECATVTYRENEVIAPIALQATNVNEANYLSCPNLYYNPGNDDSDTNCADLLDGDINSYIHTNYNAATSTYPHYLQVAFGSSDVPEQFKFTYTTRKTYDGSANQAPRHIVVKGSNDGVNFNATLGEFDWEDENAPLPATHNTNWTAPEYLTGGYAYLRFYVTESPAGTPNNAADDETKPFFAMSEFGMEARTPSGYVVTWNEGNHGTATDALVIAAYEARNAANEVLKSTATVEEIAAAEAILHEHYNALNIAKSPAQEYTVKVVGANAGGVNYDGVDHTNGSKFAAPSTLAIGDLKAMMLEGYTTGVVTKEGTIITVTYNRIYTVQVVGVEGVGGVIFAGENKYASASFDALNLTVSNLTAIEVAGYVAQPITINEGVIIVTYNKRYTISIVGGEGNGRITFDSTAYANEGTFNVRQGSFTATDLTASDVEGYNKSAVIVDHETGIISVTYTLDRTALESLIGETNELMQACRVFVNSAYVTEQLLTNTSTAITAAMETFSKEDLTYAEYTAAVSALQTTYGTLNTAKGNAENEVAARNQLKEQLNTLIGETETLIASCYENGALKYVGSDYVTEASIEEIEDAIEAARAKCNSNGTTESEYNASLETLSQMKENLATAIENANNEAAARDEKRAMLNALINNVNELITLCATTPGDATEALIDEVADAVVSAEAVANDKGSTVDELAAAIEALQAKYDVLSAAQQSTAKSDLRTLIAQTNALIEECGVVVNGRHPVATTPVALQTTDDKAAYYLSTNAQQSGEGPIANLLDGSTGSYFHSNWSSQVGEAHRLQVDMGAGHTLKEFAFSYTTRDNGTGGPHPSTIVVSGSNSLDETFVKLATINSGLPTTGNTAWNTANENVITASEAYRYLRFTVTASAGTNGCKHGNNEYFFAMSEFSLSPIIYETSYFVESMLSYGNVTEEQLINVAKARDDAEALAEESYDKVALVEATENLQALYNTLQAAHKDYSYLPVTLTTNMESPVLYTLGSGRGNTKVLQYDPADNHMLSIADASADSPAKQLFYFTKGSVKGQVFIHPFAAGEQVLAAKNTSNATAAVWATPKGTMTHQEWTIPVVNRENGTYNIKAADGSNYFSNNSGVDYKMGFWSGSNTTDPGSLFTFTLAQIEGSSAYYSLQVYCDEALKEFTNKQPGYYGANPEFEEACARAEALLSGTADYATYLEAYHALRIANETPVIILPEEGKFYRIKNNGGTGYLSSGTGTGRTQFVADIGDAASSIFYYTGGKLLSFANGMYLANNGDFLCYTNTAGAGTTITFKESPVEGKLLIEFKGNNGDRSFYSAGIGDSNAATSGQTGDSYRFTVEEVTSLPVTISKVGFATFYTPVALAIPEDVSAYVGSLNDAKDELTLIDVAEETNGIPAGTGVVLYRAEGRTASTTHYFDIVDDLEAVESAFVGNVETLVKGSSSPYTLQTHNGGVAFKLFTGANVTGFKAYLDFTEAKAQAIRIRFGKNEGTTEIEPSTLNSQSSTEAYDLMGRRVLNPMKGMYIVDGKKVIF